jgi:predicted DNA-binding transcriptional regulator AlpA
MVDLADLIRAEEAAALMGISTRGLRKRVSKGQCPAPIRFGDKGCRYRESEIMRWLETTPPVRRGPKSRHTTDAGAAAD